MMDRDGFLINGKIDHRLRDYLFVKVSNKDAIFGISPHFSSLVRSPISIATHLPVPTTVSVRYSFMLYLIAGSRTVFQIYSLVCFSYFILILMCC